MSTPALRETSAAVQTSAKEIESKATLSTTGASAAVVGAAGHAKPAQAIRRFLDTAHDGTRSGLADQDTLADQLNVAARSYEQIDNQLSTVLRTHITPELPGDMHHRANTDTSREDRSDIEHKLDQHISPSPPDQPQTSTTPSSHQHGDISAALNPEPTTEQPKRSWPGER